jgi:hypothetical protein
MTYVRNDLELLAEEYHPIRKRLVGNFPQGFSHIGLINTAFNLIDVSGPAQQRSKRAAVKQKAARAVSSHRSKKGGWFRRR